MDIQKKKKTGAVNKGPDRIIVLLLKVILVEAVILLVLGLIVKVAGNPTLKRNKSDVVKQSEHVTERDTETETDTETESEIVTEGPKTMAEALGIPEPPAIDINSWEYVLVNSEHKLDESFAPETDFSVSLTSTIQQDERIVDALDQFASDCEDAGYPVYLSSGYRSYQDQQYLFDLQCQYYTEEEAAKIVAIPGTSEHQTGLCCDITDYYREFKNEELADTDTYKWLYAHCAEYGFILRYPEDKEDITNIIYEPWHFRYVGVEAAEYIMKYGLCLEEFVQLYEPYDPSKTVTRGSAVKQTENTRESTTETETDVRTIPETESEEAVEI